MNDIIIYQNGEIELNVSIQDEWIWLTQRLLIMKLGKYI